jgi:hypothetical protein
MATAYLSPVTVRAPSTALSKAPYEEHNRAVEITKDLLSQIITIAPNKRLFDTTLCTTYHELITTNPKAPYVIGTQVHWDTIGGWPLVSKITSSTEDRQFKYDSSSSSKWRSRELTVSIATKSLGLILEESWEPIPVTQRNTGAIIRAAADAYLDLCSQTCNKTYSFLGHTVASFGRSCIHWERHE